MTSEDGLQFSPPAMPEYWTLQVAARVPSVVGKLRAALREARTLFWESPDGIISAQVRADKVESLCVHVERWLDTDDLDSCHARLYQGEVDESSSKVLDAEPLRRILARRWGHELLEMISEDRLRVRFQPIVSLVNPSRVHGYEVLLRGVAKGDDLVFPDRLLDAALEVNLLLELDLAARRNALARAAKRIPNGAIFINARREALCSTEEFVSQTLEAVHEYGLPPSRVVIEVSRGVPDLNSSSIVSTLDRCRAEGFSIAIDDFTEAPSFFDLLHRIRPEYVKFERGLVRSVDRDSFKQEALDAIVSECLGLKVATIALGVETRAEWEWLKVRGVTMGQGYLFGVPAEIPAGPAETRLPVPEAPV